MASYNENVTERSGPTEEPLTRGHRPLVGAGAAATTAAAAAASVASAAIVPAGPPHGPGPKTRYQVIVYTGDVPDAGTDADIWLWVDGTAGRRSGWRFLDNPDEDNFERGRTDYFKVNFPNNDLGVLTAAWIYFRRIGNKPNCFLSKVVVNGKTFSYNNWIVTTGLYPLTPT